MRRAECPLTAVVWRASLFASLLFFCGGARGGLFPHVSQRYLVGDPEKGNPLDSRREGPKTVAVGDLNGDGLCDVVTGNLDGSVSVILADSSGGMREQAYFRAGGSIRSVVICDLDGDGKLDVAAADITQGVSILLGNGDGSLRLSGTIPLVHARSLAVGDCSGDGIPDLLVGSSPPDCERGRPGHRGVSVLLGHGDGTFDPPRFLTGKPTGCLYDVSLADLNRDGYLDALALDYSHRAILIFAGNGDGTFTMGPPLALAGRGPRAFRVAYLDERLIDGAPPPGATLDIVVAHRDSATLNVFLGQGTFDFAGPVSIPSGDSPRSVVAGDLNGDGLVELIVANRNTNSISVLRGLGDGRFSTPLQMAAGTSPREIALGDLNGDGALDAAVANRISGDVSIFIGRRGLAGFLVPERYYPAGITPVGVVAEDFNEDGLPDAATVNLRSHDVRVRLNLGDGNLGEEMVYPVNFQPSSLAAQDINDDSHCDLVVACVGSSAYYDSQNRGSLVTLLGVGDGTFITWASTTGDTVSFQPYWLRLGDLSGDGVLDAAVGGLNGKLVLSQGRGDGTFHPPVVLLGTSRGAPLTVTLGDFNGDGSLDIATSRGYMLLNDGTFFEPAWSGEPLLFPVNRGDWVVESADLDQDGILDLIVALTFVEPDPIAVHFGVGDGTFLRPTIYEMGMGVVALRAADMDRDGITDIVSGNRCTADVTVLRGLGDRRFEHLETVRTYSVEGLELADMNGDGWLDLVGAGLALWVVLNGDDPRLRDPETANFAGILPAEGLYINELMAQNRDFFETENNNTPDWLEIYNHTPGAQVLGGWILRQHSRNGQETDWPFPDGTIVPAQEYLVVLCDGAQDPGPGLHASFRLDSEGESVSLVGPSGEVADRVDFPAMPADVSYARFVDAARYLSYNPVPTMGSANVAPSNLSPSVDARNPFLTGTEGEIGITARGFDDIGLAYASVHFRLEGETEFQEMLLDDDGTHGDGGAGDGLYGARLPAVPVGSTVVYYLRVVDLEGEVTTEPGDIASEADLLRVVVPPAWRRLRISEVVADNQTGLRDETGTPEDWLEIVNCSTETVSLGRFVLTQDYFDLEEAWHFPRGLSLAPGERAVFFCDGEGEQGVLHVNFRLNRDGDSVVLMQRAPDDRWLLTDAIAFGPLPPDTAFGIAECQGEAVILPSPTPGRPNAEGEILFARGDANGDARVNLIDVVYVLRYVFTNEMASSCLDAMDPTDDGRLNLADVVTMLLYLFKDPGIVPYPLGECGLDPTPDNLTCEWHPACR